MYVLYQNNIESVQIANPVKTIYQNTIIFMSSYETL